MFENVRMTFRTHLENLLKSSKNGRNSSENRKNFVISMFIKYKKKLMVAWNFSSRVQLDVSGVRCSHS